VRSWRLLVAAFLAGATLLALEVVWFRFLQLFVYGTGFIFAAMLAAILLASVRRRDRARWLGRDPQAQRFAPLVALAPGSRWSCHTPCSSPGLAAWRIPRPTPLRRSPCSSV